MIEGGRGHRPSYIHFSLIPMKRKFVMLRSGVLQEDGRLEMGVNERGREVGVYHKGKVQDYFILGLFLY